ncbi:Gfo/Idh/MocA family protein [Crateriforma spongiae]|uniref:Gfo/Idh/MocA family protein n=1 Tax=Crateriforma spongiae TaxID=2724528 RepID=UPI001448246F|nr:Gfo/Idh/MocA family oxidoreductase [Crateriforma spongiae]
MRRREFLASTAAALLAAVQSSAYAAAGDTPIRAGLIGSGWYGKTDLFHLIQVAPVEVVGICDVDSKMAEEAAQLVSQRHPSGKVPPTYGKHEDLLSKHKPDVVLIGTPDHWHCLPMIDACRAGADVYVQKPISWDVAEGQAMVAAARKYNRTVQVGLQRRSTPHLLQARDRFIRSGKLGKIAYVDVHAYGGGPRDFPATQAPPENLDWDRYVGPAPWRDYNPGIHPRRWRACGEFSNGKTGDLCVHFLDVVRYFLDLGMPKTIAATGGRYMLPPDSNVNLHDTQNALFDFGDVQVTWNQRNWGTNPEPDYSWGATLYGDKGTLKLSVRSYDFIPKGRGQAEHGDWVDESEQYPEDQQHKETEMFAAPATRRHMQDFVEARREGRRPVADIAEGHASTACCLLANLSMRLGRSLAWDADAGRVIDDDEANQQLARPYRGDWEHPTAQDV